MTTKKVSFNQCFLKEIQTNVRHFLKNRPRQIETLEKKMIEDIKTNLRTLSKQGETQHTFTTDDIIETSTQTYQLLPKLSDKEIQAIIKSLQEYFELEGFSCEYKDRYSSSYTYSSGCGKQLQISWKEN